MNHFLTIRAYGLIYCEVYVLMPSHFTVAWISRQSLAGPYDCWFCDGKRKARCQALSQKGARAWIVQQTMLTPPKTGVAH